MYIALKERVEKILPKWKSWYANPFDAATDLGLLKATVSDPDSLNLNKRIHVFVNKLSLLSESYGVAMVSKYNFLFSVR